MARNTKQSTKTTLPQVTVTDEQYLDLLAIRLGAMKGFEAGTVTDAQKNEARSAVRQARKIRKAEASQLQDLREALEAKQAARSEAAQKAAKTRASKKAAKVADPETESVPEAEETPVAIAA